MVLTIRSNGPSLLYLLAAVLLGSGATYALMGAGDRALSIEPAAPEPVRSAAPCNVTVTGIDGFRHIRPLLSSELQCPSTRMEPIRNELGLLVDSLRNAQVITSASVHLRDLKRGDWTVLNPDERFDPGSMLKVPLLLCYLSMAEEDPAVLKRTYTCEPVDAGVPQNTAFPDQQAVPGAVYTVEQLLALSIIYSDNRATAMLLRHMDPNRYLGLFTDLGLARPVWKAKQYRMTARDCSVFLTALYHSSLLSPVRSEKALDLLFRSTFTHGLVAGLPEGIEVAHKFGEAGDPTERQLHETGLVYMAGHPYIITVMTRGAETKELAKAIALLSARAHRNMSSL